MVGVTAAPEEFESESRRFGTTTSERAHLVAWLQERGVQEVVMESTAQYWKPVWLDLEPHFRLHLAQAFSNKAPKGRKHDFGDAKRLVRRLVAGELILSLVPDSEQRGWRTMTRGKLQLIGDRVRLQNQMEALLEEMRIELSSVVSDLLGVSGRRILRALADGESDPVKLGVSHRPRYQVPVQPNDALLENFCKLRMSLSALAKIRTVRTPVTRTNFTATPAVRSAPSIETDCSYGMLSSASPCGSTGRIRV